MTPASGGGPPPTCRGCDAPGLSPVVSLGSMPPVNAYVDPAAPGVERAYPLDLWFCARCTLVQLSPVVDPPLLYGSYTYLSSASRTNVARLEALADELARDFALDARARVLEIGSNDGTLLARLRGRAHAVVGVDPARNVAPLAEAAGVRTVVAFFSERLARELARDEGPFDLVLALNVVAHTPDFRDLLGGVRALLAPRGRCVVEVVHVLPTLLAGEIDTIYHEHVYCFSLLALAHACAPAGLALVDAERIAAQGGSLRVVLARAEGAPPPGPRVGQILAEERAAGLDRAETYARVASLARALRAGVSEGVRALRGSADAVVGLGASARGVVLMNYCGLGPADVDFVVDDTPLKQGKLMPGCHVPVHDWTKIAKGMKVAGLMLSWNYRREVLAKLAARTSCARVLVPLPVLEEVVLPADAGA
ncbi:MAG TPA: class I SAM-dependent methyltransferase [Polyangia bacterium]|nr:class I SAM-dependent methyltransferase [Polyangia bacterium]